MESTRAGTGTGTGAAGVTGTGSRSGGTVGTVLTFKISHWTPNSMYFFIPIGNEAYKNVFLEFFLVFRAEK